MHYVSLGKTESGQDVVGCGHRVALVRNVDGGNGTSPLIISGAQYHVGGFVFEISQKTIVIYCGETCYRLHKNAVAPAVALALMEASS